MNLFKKYGTDASAETTGVLIKVDEAVFRIKRAGGNNRAFRYSISKHAIKYREEFVKYGDLRSAGEIPPEIRARIAEVEDEIHQQAFADEVLAGWENVDGPDGSPLEFTRENFLMLVRACPDVWQTLKTAAFDIDNFRAADGAKLGE